MPTKLQVLHLDVKRAGCKLGLAVAASKSDLGLLVRGLIVGNWDGSCCLLEV